MRISRATVAAFLAATFVLQGTVPARAETPLTKDQGDAILKELGQIRGLLESIQKQGLRQPARQPRKPVNLKVSVKGSPTLGDPEAPLVLVEFTDYQCPFCSRFHANAYGQIKKNFVDTGKLLYVSRDLPLAFHKQAKNAAHAAHCAGEQGKFWEMRHVLLANFKKIDGDSITQFAQELPLDMHAYEPCMESAKYAAAIDKSVRDANALGVTGTPTFVLANNTGDVVEGVRLVGAQPYASFESQIKSRLASLKKEGKKETPAN